MKKLKKEEEGSERIFIAKIRAYLRTLVFC